jgi:phosphoserine aminotransferase
MKNIYFTVGPSQIYPTVAAHTQQAIADDIFSLNHRGKEFEALYKSIDIQLKTLLSIPQDYSVFVLSSGTEAMERIVQNTVKSKSLHIVTGTFGDRMYQTAVELGKNAISHVFEPTNGFSAEDITVESDVELIAFTHNDTSTGMQIPMDSLYAVAAQNPNALVSIDCVSSVPAVHVDFARVDMVFFSVQKGFGMPAGLGILVASPRAVARANGLHAENVPIGSYHSFVSLSKYYEKFQTPDTPNVFGMYLLERVLSDFLTMGIDTIRTQTDEKADMLYDYFAGDEKYTPLVTDSLCLSQTTLVIAVSGGSKKIIDTLAQKGIIIGTGYGERKDLDIRIANFPAHSKDQVEQLITELQKIS